MLGIHHAGAAVTEQRCTPVTLVVNFVEGHPVFDFMLVAFEYHFRETYKEINHFTVGPATVLLHQMQRHFKVGEGYHRFDVVFQQFIEHIIVELQPFFVWLSFITFWKNTRPGDGSPKTFEAHFGK